MKIIRIILTIIGVIVAITIGGFVYVYSLKPEQPKLSAIVQHASIRVGNFDRSYTFYVPSHLPDKASLLFVLHGAGLGAEGMRIFSGYEFDLLADSKGFIVVYPVGFEYNWNDCRKTATHPAKKKNIDDKKFIRALISEFRQRYNVDTSRVFITGLSNGAHMAYRLAFEMSSEITAIAAVAASIPISDNMGCIESGKPIPVLIMNGTEDPMSPYEGGNVSVYGYSSRGVVRSTVESAQYFAKLAGYSDTPTKTETLPHLKQSDPTRVRRDVWRTIGKPEIVLYSIIGGGHLLPQQKFRAPQWFFGRTTSDLDGPAVIWDFFNRQPSNKESVM